MSPAGETAINAKDKLRGFASTGLRAFVRPLTPSIVSEYNGVKVGHHRYLDRFLPAERPFDSDYKENLVQAVNLSVDRGDAVVVIGGGFGVTSVHAYRDAGDSGSVIVYECSEERFENCRDCFELNNCTDIDLREEAVGVVKKKVGSVSGSGFVHPSDLPECDVLELDCEGAEAEILEEMSIRPGKIVVETHGKYDASTRKVKKILDRLGYRIKVQLPDASYTDDNVLVAEYIEGDILD